MKVPTLLAMFPIDPGAPVTFAVPPRPVIKRFLAAIGTEVVVDDSYAEGDATNEMLACGPAPAASMARLLPRFWPDRPVRHLIVRPDASQRVWTCGDFVLRQVACAEDLEAELARRRPALCLLEHHQIVIRAAMEAYLKLLLNQRNGDPDARAAVAKAVDRTALELMPELIRISPSTKFVITSHHKGSGISRADRDRYAKFATVVKVIGRPDSTPAEKQLAVLIRRLYPRAAA